MGLKPPNGGTGLPRRAPHVHDAGRACGWARLQRAALFLSAGALLATLVTLCALHLMIGGMQFPGLAVPSAVNLAGRSTFAGNLPAPLAGDAAVEAEASDAHKVLPSPPVAPPPFVHPLPELIGYYTLPAQDNSQRCLQSKICDGDHSCGPDGLGCITDTAQRQEHVRQAIAWAWKGYRCENAYLKPSLLSS